MQSPDLIPVGFDWTVGDSMEQNTAIVWRASANVEYLGHRTTLCTILIRTDGPIGGYTTHGQVPLFRPVYEK